MARPFEHGHARSPLKGTYHPLHFRPLLRPERISEFLGCFQSERTTVRWSKPGILVRGCVRFFQKTSGVRCSYNTCLEPSKAPRRIRLGRFIGVSVDQRKRLSGVNLGRPVKSELPTHWSNFSFSACLRVFHVPFSLRRPLYFVSLSLSLFVAAEFSEHRVAEGNFKRPRL